MANSDDTTLRGALTHAAGASGVPSVRETVDLLRLNVTCEVIGFHLRGGGINPTPEVQRIVRQAVAFCSPPLADTIAILAVADSPEQADQLFDEHPMNLLYAVLAKYLPTNMSESLGISNGVTPLAWGAVDEDTFTHYDATWFTELFNYDPNRWFSYTNNLTRDSRRSWSRDTWNAAGVVTQLLGGEKVAQQFPDPNFERVSRALNILTAIFLGLDSALVDDMVRGIVSADDKDANE